jgi:succinate-acetate transporter protein
MFAIKALIKTRPFTVQGVALMISLFQMGFCIRIFERPLSEASGQDFNLFSNTFWNVLVTMTTVGYGDYYAKTLVGRIMGLFIAFWGVFIVSLFTVTLANLFDFDQGEMKVRINEK